MLPKLFYLPHSPWSMKALCAVHYQGLSVTPVAYRPFLDEPGLRMQLARAGGRWAGRVSVPILFTEQGVAQDSWAIARYAAQHGSGPNLVPEADLDAISAWNDRSERLLDAGRALFMLAVLEDPAACRELVPQPVAGLPLPLVRGSLHMFNRKYGIRAADRDRYAAVLDEELDAVRAALPGEGSYLTGRFSYADIAIGLALQMLVPIPGTGFGPASEKFEAVADLAARYPDVRAWRDALHRAHPLDVMPAPNA